MIGKQKDGWGVSKLWLYRADYLFPLLFLTLGWAVAFPAWAETIETCSPNEKVNVGPYTVQTDYWNQNKCPGVQCVNINDQTGSFSVTGSTAVCPDVSSYPSIVYGRAWSVTSRQFDLPARISSLRCVNSSWDFAPTYTGSWDAAYDLWVCPDDSCGNSGFNGGAEVMIWLDYLNAPGWKEDKGPVTLEGKTWEVWECDPSITGAHWTYIAYLAKTMVRSASNLDVNAFLKDCVARGYVKPSWYLCAVEAGNEMRDQGVPFTSNSFSVSVNQGCGAKPVYVPVTILAPTFSNKPNMTSISH